MKFGDFSYHGFTMFAFYGYSLLNDHIFVRYSHSAQHSVRNQDKTGEKSSRRAI